MFGIIILSKKYEIDRRQQNGMILIVYISETDWHTPFCHMQIFLKFLQTQCLLACLEAECVTLGLILLHFYTAHAPRFIRDSVPTE